MLPVALCVVILASAVHCFPIEIEAKAKCGSAFNLTLEEDYRVISKAVADTNDTCTVKFTSETNGDCKGTCYMFDQYAEIRDNKVTLTVGKMEQNPFNVKLDMPLQPTVPFVELKVKPFNIYFGNTYRNGSNFPNTPVCSDDVTVDVALIHAAGYKYNETNPTYKFKLNVYNKCGPKGKHVNLTFADVVSEVDGYHHAEEKESRERNVFLAGVLVGSGFAVFFLIVGTVVICFMRNKMNRRYDSNAMPKLDGKQTFTPGQQPVEVEMGVRYKATEDGTGEIVKAALVFEITPAEEVKKEDKTKT